MRALVLGLGAVGARAARQLASSTDVEVLVADPRPGRAGEVTSSLGAAAEGVEVSPSASDPLGGVALDGLEVAVLAGPGEAHPAQARALVEAGVPVVSVADGLAVVQDLLDLGSLAESRHVPVLVGAGFSPGLSCVLARHAAALLDEVSEVHVARVGTAGPACAIEHHQALAGSGVDWRDGAWQRRRSGSGRELCWFPDPVGAADCYRAALPDPVLLVPAFPSARRITARLAATRRDRLTARLPMLRRPHPEGGPGALRVEVRGVRAGASETVVYGAMDRPGVGGGAVAAVVALAAAERRLLRPAGAMGLAEAVDPVPVLAELSHRGVRAAVFAGA